MTITSAAPFANLRGINDQSRGQLEPVAEALPMHLPMIHLLCERGPTTPVLGIGTALTGTFGEKTFDYTEAYANQATVMANTIMGQGNSIMVQRVVPADAKQARLRLNVEIVAAEVPEYQRRDDGDFILDQFGQKQPTGDVVNGYKVRWFTEPMAEGELLGQASQRTGDLTGASEATSTVFPIMEIPAHHVGKYGNNLGFRLYAPTTRSSVEVDGDIIDDQGAYLYRLQIVERPSENASPLVQQTLTSGQYVEFAFKDGVINPKLDTQLSFDRVVDAAYTDLNTSDGFPAVYGPFGQIEVYQQNIEAVLTALHGAEDAAVGGLGTDMHSLNFMGGVDYDGTPYHAIEVVGPADGGILLSETATHYLKGGDDGDLSWANFDQLVGDDVANFENSQHNLMDDATYPISAYWDPGYSLDTKRKLLTPIGLRKDIYVVLSTQDITEPQNTADEDSSIGVALRTAARLYPESAFYGTATCRCIVVEQAGTLNGGNFKGLVPQTVDLAQKVAAFMGASSGIAAAGRGFDQSPTNQITSLRALNNTYKPARVRNADWNNGMVWSQAYDRRSFFYPAIQTVYDDDTSVLNSAINMMFFTELEKVCQRVWRDLSGNSKLTNAQFIERSNALISERTVGRFDGRLTVIPETFLTEDDSNRGYSWSCNINAYGNNMKTVGTFTVNAFRSEDLV
tara:strand:+ start:14964 stop:17009 length:2046 start_codon:yes stop_codon:yes gene_type:complete